MGENSVNLSALGETHVESFNIVSLVAAAASTAAATAAGTTSYTHDSLSSPSPLFFPVFLSTLPLSLSPLCVYLPRLAYESWKHLSTTFQGLGRKVLYCVQMCNNINLAIFSFRLGAYLCFGADNLLQYDSVYQRLFS